MSASKESQDSITELSVDTLDTALKLVTESEIFDEIPILGFLRKVGKAASTVSNSLFLRKLDRFMQSTNEKITQSERIKFAENFKNQSEKIEEFYENLLLRIDKIDDTTKPSILGRIYASRISGRISEEDFQGLCHALSSSRLGDLVEFSSSFWVERYKYGMPKISDKTERNLISSGLVTFNLYETERQSRLGIPAPYIPKLPPSFGISEPPYRINFSITELGFLYAYIAEDLEEYFQPNSPEQAKLGQPSYKFTEIQNDSLRKVVREKWKLQN